MTTPIISATHDQMYLFLSIQRYQHRDHVEITRIQSDETNSHLIFISSGKGTLEIGQKIYHSEPMQTYFLPAGTPIKGMLYAHHIQYFVVSFQTISLTRGEHQWVGTTSDVCTSLLTSGFIKLSDPLFMYREIKNLYDTHLIELNRIRTNLILQNLLLHIHTQRNAVSELQLERQPKWNGIEESITYMHTNLNKKMNRDTLAAIAKLTPSSYCRSFKKTKGISPMDYLNQIRIEQAKQLLAAGHSCKKVAYRLGYVSEYYFSRVFKKTTGLPPTIYMKREHSKIAVASRFGIQLNLESMGVEPILVIDCYPHPGIDADDYNRRLMNQLEELRSAEPDLIIGDYSHASFYETFKRIAPTVIFENDLDWLTTHRKISELVGREIEAQIVVEALDKKIAGARQWISQLEKVPTVSVLQMMNDHFYLQGTKNHPLNHLLYNELRLSAGKHVPKNKMRLELYPADLPPMDSDYLWIRMYSDTPEVIHTLQRLKEHRNWSSIQAVHNNQVHFINNWLVMSWTPQGREQIVDEVLGYLANTYVTV